MQKQAHHLVQGVEWLPCCIGVVFNLYCAYQEDIRRTAPADLTHREQGLYCAYSAYQFGATIKGDRVASQVSAVRFKKGFC